MGPSHLGLHWRDFSNQNKRLWCNALHYGYFHHEPGDLKGWTNCSAKYWLQDLARKFCFRNGYNFSNPPFKVFGAINIAATIFSYFLPETKGLTLEEMDVLFGVVDESTRKHNVEINLRQKQVDLDGQRV